MAAMLLPVRIPGARLWNEAARLLDIDWRIEAALIATTEEDGVEHAVAVYRMIREEAFSDTAEVTIIVRDDFQRHGFGRMIFDLLMQIALAQTINRPYAITLPEDLGMQRLARGVGLPATVRTRDGEMLIIMHLRSA